MSLPSQCFPEGRKLQACLATAGLLLHLFLVTFSSLPPSGSFTSQALGPESLSQCTAGTHGNQAQSFPSRTEKERI